jgi:hypothetical protein
MIDQIYPILVSKQTFRVGSKLTNPILELLKKVIKEMISKCLFPDGNLDDPNCF